VLSTTQASAHHVGQEDVLTRCMQARKLGVQELQCQAWGGSADALEVSALSLLELDPFFITVRPD